MGSARFVCSLTIQEAPIKPKARVCQALEHDTLLKVSNASCEPQVFLSHVLERSQTFQFVYGEPKAVRPRVTRKRIFLKGLILAQNERWRRGLGMQVE
jgi:hypothetical protein